MEDDPGDIPSTQKDQCEHKYPGKKQSVKGERLAVQSCWRLVCEKWEKECREMRTESV